MTDLHKYCRTSVFCVIDESRSKIVKIYTNPKYRYACNFAGKRGYKVVRMALCLPD